MISILDPTADCETKRTPTANRSATAPRSPRKRQRLTENTPEQGEDEPGFSSEWDTFSQALAAELNKRQPDIVAALLFTHISFRSINLPAYCAKDGRRWYFRSIKELHEKEFPYLTELQIEDALGRLKAAKKLVIEPEGVYGPTPWFHIPEPLRKQYKKSKKPSGKHIWLKKEDALQHGVRPALLLANLRWQLNEWEAGGALKTDTAGNRFGQLSPSYLSKVLRGGGFPPMPLSRRSIIGYIGLLKATGAIVEHPEFPGYYTLRESMLTETGCDGSKSGHRAVQDPPAPVQDSLAPVQISAAAVQVSPDSSERKAPQPASMLDPEPMASGVNSNINSNVERNKNRKVIFRSPVSAAPSQDSGQASELSAGGRMLLSAIEESLTAFRQKQDKKSHAPLRQARVTPDHLPYDDIRGVNEELPYDTVIPRALEIKNAIAWITQYWRTYKVKYRAKDLDDLTRLFVANPMLTLRMWRDIEYHIGVTQSRSRWWDERVGATGRVRTASGRLYLLPQIIHEMHVSFISEWDVDDPRCEPGLLVPVGEVEEPYRCLDFSVLEEVCENDQFRVIPEPVRFVEHETTPTAGA